MYSFFSQLNSNKLDSEGAKIINVRSGDKQNLYLRLNSKETWHKAFAIIAGANNDGGVIFEVVGARVNENKEIKVYSKSLSTTPLTWESDSTKNWNIHAEGLANWGIYHIFHYGFDAIGMY